MRFQDPVVSADTLNKMLEPEVESLAGTEPEPRPATRGEETRWWTAIVAVLAITMVAVWVIGQLAG
jgi:hypothetical protein